MKNRLLVYLILTVLAIALCACAPAAPAETTASDVPAAPPEATLTATANAAETAEPRALDAGSIILSTTTSTADSGLLDAILPDFTEKTGIEVKVVAVGTGAALKNGEDANCDVVLVHAKASEEAFVKNGFGLERFDVMYNDFVLLGPSDDPLEIGTRHSDDTGAALKAILEDGKTTFVSRGDDSGTHKKELEIWQHAGLTPEGDWYVEAGQGMGAVLTMADELKAYTLSDRATYLSRKSELDLVVVTEGDQVLLNQYGVIAVNPALSEAINAAGAETFIEWILSADTQALIGGYGVAEFGEPLFVPNAKR